MIKEFEELRAKAIQDLERRIKRAPNPFAKNFGHQLLLFGEALTIYMRLDLISLEETKVYQDRFSEVAAEAST